MTTTNKIAPIHPGEVLSEDFMKGFGITAKRLSEQVGIPEDNILQIVAGTKEVTADDALRFAQYFETTPRFWLNLQSQYDLDLAEDAAGDQIEKISPVYRV